MVVTTNEWQVVQVMQQSRWPRLLLLVMLDSENTHMPDWDKSREAREAELPVGRISPTVFQL